MTPEMMKMLAVGLVGGLGLLGPALGIGMIGYSAMQALARNPEAKSAIQTNMLISAALAEACGIYVLIVAIILAMVVE